MSACLILAAGIGSRMENPVINKGLLPITGKAIITHIIENVNCDEIIIAVGYKAQQVKDYCACAHPDKNIKFVDVDNYNGPGSGPGYSMWCCRDYLQQPFYLVTADSFLGSQIPDLDVDWIGVSYVTDLENYATCESDNDGIIIDFKNKQKKDYCPLAFTGVLGVLNYKAFWEKFEDYRKLNPEKEIELVGALYKPFYDVLYARNIDWVDIGRKKLYNSFYLNSKNFAEYDLKKIDVEEYLYKIDRKVLKISTEERITAKKSRSTNLIGLIPEISNEDFKNIFSYKFVEGKTLYEVSSLDVYKKFLDWLEANLFSRLKPEPKDFEKLCLDFYRKKTWQRLKKYCDKNEISTEFTFQINGKKLNIEKVWESIDWDHLCKNGISYAFHGDLNFGNVIYDENEIFTLIDWREDFSGSDIGDLYYDFGKLYAGSLINFYVANKDENLLEIEKDSIIVNDCTTKECEEFRKHFEEWISNKNYDLQKIKLLAGLIIISMSPLHPDNFGTYLFYYGLNYLASVAK